MSKFEKRIFLFFAIFLFAGLSALELAKGADQAGVLRWSNFGRLQFALAISTLAVCASWYLRHRPPLWSGVGTDLLDPEPGGCRICRTCVVGAVAALVLATGVYGAISYAHAQNAAKDDPFTTLRTDLAKLKESVEKLSVAVAALTAGRCANCPAGAPGGSPPVAAPANVPIVTNNINVDRIAKESVQHPQEPCLVRVFPLFSREQLVGRWRMTRSIEFRYPTGGAQLSEEHVFRLRDFMFGLLDATGGVIRARSHVDSRGNHAENRLLATQRALWTMHGIVCVLTEAGLVNDRAACNSLAALLKQAKPDAVDVAVAEVLAPVKVERFSSLAKAVTFNERAGPEPDERMPSATSVANYRNRTTVVEYFERCDEDTPSPDVRAVGQR